MFLFIGRFYSNTTYQQLFTLGVYLSSCGQSSLGQDIGAHSHVVLLLHVQE